MGGRRWVRGAQIPCPGQCRVEQNASVEPTLISPWFQIDTGDGKIGVLDVKLQRTPTGYYFLKLEDQEKLLGSFQHDAERCRLAQQMMCPCPDPYSGWIQLQVSIVFFSSW